jgi:outer membrane protein
MTRFLHIPLFFLAAIATAAHGEDLVTSWQAAREYDATLAAARDTLTAGMEQANQATAVILPQVNLIGANEQQEEDYRSGNIAEAASERTSGRVTGWSVSLAQPIYDANTFATRTQLLKETARSQLAFRIAAQDLILHTAQACFDVPLAQSNLTLVRAATARLDTATQAIREVCLLRFRPIIDDDALRTHGRRADGARPGRGCWDSSAAGHRRGRWAIGLADDHAVHHAGAVRALRWPREVERAR